MATHSSVLIVDDAYRFWCINEVGVKSDNSRMSVLFALKDELALVEIVLNCGI